jgi:hypothetical protein
MGNQRYRKNNSHGENNKALEGHGHASPNQQKILTGNVILKGWNNPAQ